MTRTEARTFLIARHSAMSQRYPVGMAKVPLSLYLRRNLRAAMLLTVDAAASLREATR